MTGAPATSQAGSGWTHRDAPPRGQIYAVLSTVFTFPDRHLHETILQEDWPGAVSAAVSRLPHSLHVPARGWGVPASYDRFQSEYIRLFEVGGRGGPPCPLHSGHYTSDRLRTMETLVRFYNFFGLAIVEGMMPDHASVELEFMYYLTASEAGASSKSEAASLLRAQHDFLRGHLAGWWPQLAGQVTRSRPAAFYKSAVDLTLRFLRGDERYVEQCLSDARETP